MTSPAQPNDRLPNSGKSPQGVSLQGTQLPEKQSDNNGWQPVHLPGTIAADQFLGPTLHLRTNAMDSSSTYESNSNLTGSTTSEQPSQRETELLNLVRDLNECNDVLLAKVSQLEDSLERSQAALQAEIDRAGPPVGDREIVQLVTELEQSNQALHHHQQKSETMQTELTVLRERAAHLETEHTALLQDHTVQSQELLQVNTTCRDLRARLQRQQRYTLQFKAALEKCLSMSTGGSSSSTTGLDTPGITMPTVEKIRPWESVVGQTKLDPQLEAMIRGPQPHPQSAPSSSSEMEAEDQLWHDLARVMDPADVPLESSVLEEDTLSIQDKKSSTTEDTHSLQFTEPSPWSQGTDTPSQNVPKIDDAAENPAQLSPEASEILARVQSARAGATTETYLPAMAVQHSPSPLVSPLKPQKRISSLSAIDLPNFPRLKKQAPKAKA